MCGGDLDIAEGVSIAECEYCGTKQTVPKATDENLQNLFNRANTLRIKSEFDKAEKLYEKLIQADSTQSEAYWGLILCKYGIEYVDDPATFKKVPTCHRASFESIVADDDYKSALKNADLSQRAIYEEQAKEIDRIQKEILALAQKEENYDIFICYKQTDAAGHRTQDSVIANDIYYQLTQEGFKVFYAAITLEGKLGSAYEPIIFAALNSAKVMLVIGTKPEHFNAVWVKNEWSRYLKIIKKNRSKLLIPCYRDMDAYELPEEFAHLQAQDMSKIGFINDVVRGVKKVLKKDESKPSVVKETIVASPVNVGVAPLLKRVFIFCEDEDWEKADEYCEKVLDIDPENAQVYIGKLMVEFKAQHKEDLWTWGEMLLHTSYYERAVKYAQVNDPTTYAFVTELRTKICIQSFDETYESLAKKFKNAEREEEFLFLHNKFEKLSKDEWAPKSENYSEILRLIEECKEKAETARQEDLEATYSKALFCLNSKNNEDEYKEAARLFESVSGYKDADELAAKALENAEFARKDNVLATAKSKMSRDDLRMCGDAFNLLSSISGWRDADEQMIICQNKIADLKVKAEEERIEKEKAAKKERKIYAIVLISLILLIAFITILSTVIIPSIVYNNALDALDAGEYSEAISAFERIVGYKDSSAKLEECLYLQAFQDMKNASVGDIVTFGAYEQDGKSVNGKEGIEWEVLEKQGNKVLLISKYVLDYRAYHEEASSNKTWATCYLRTWLNESFINTAFSEAEKSRILTVTVSDEKNIHGISPGPSTQDKIFVLSISEAKKYFNSASERECPLTDYAKAQNGTQFQDNGDCWWLRSPGRYNTKTAFVNVYGQIDQDGSEKYARFGIRPAMWVDLSNAS